MIMQFDFHDLRESILLLVVAAACVAMLAL